ncbi:MAG: efflux RND transporter periplasmic adaptor subunit [Pseudomonadota bacterium]
MADRPRYRRYQPPPAPFTAPADEALLASLFDGHTPTAALTTPAAQRLGAAVSAAELEHFASRLAEAGRLQAGSHEPLPVPAHTEAEQLRLDQRGLSGQQREAAERHALPPSSMPGSLAQPAVMPSATGALGDRRGDAVRIDVPLSASAFVWLGRLLVWPLVSVWHLSGLLLLCIVALCLLYSRRIEWLAFGVLHLPGVKLVIAVVLAGWLVNLFSMAARVAAVMRFTPEAPRFGIRYGWLKIPYFVADTAGAAARMDRGTRLRLVAAGLTGTALLMVLGIVLWFLTATTTPNVAGVAASAASAAVISLLLRSNPLAMRDGYWLLANALDVLDLRQQADFALYGAERPWMTQAKKLPRTALLWFSGLSFAYALASLGVILWFLGGALEARLQGTGVVLISALVGIFMFKQYQRTAVEKTAMGQLKSPPWRPSRKQLWWAGGLLLLSLLPYPHSPGGSFEVLPRDRADVRALTSGDVREVLVREGDTVKAGQALARLDDTGQKAKVAGAEAALARLQADLALAKKGAKSEEIDVARQRVATARANANLASGSFDRIASAYKGKSVTPQDYDRAKGAAEVARQQLIEAERSLALVSSPTQDDRIKALEAEVRGIQVDLDYQREQLAATTLAAPIAGVVVAPRLLFARGSYLDRGALLATIEDTAELIAEVKLPESSIGDITLGAAASAKPWAFPNSSFKGSVRSIAPNAEEGKYGKIVRVNVTVSDPSGTLKAGMTGNAKVSAGWSFFGLVFTRSISRFVMVELWSWIP